VGGVRARSLGTAPGWRAVARAVAIGCLATLIFVALILGFAGVLDLLGERTWHHAPLWLPLVGVVYWVLVGYTLHWRRAERSTWPEGRPRPRPWSRLRSWFRRRRRRRSRSVSGMVVFWGYLMPFVAVLGILLAAISFSTSWSAARGGGHPGTLLLHEYRCHRHSCSWLGQFRSDDGTVVRESVTICGDVPAGARVNDQVRARDTGDRTCVFAGSGSFRWLGSAIGVVVCLGYLAGWGAWMVIMVRWRRDFYGRT
jgi:hypothetical protein